MKVCSAGRARHPAGHDAGVRPRNRYPAAPMSTQWDPDQYLRFGDERARPFGELIARIPDPSPRLVVDLGCGPGTATAQLLQRWPGARVIGVDNSAQMIEHAETLAVPGRLGFEVADLRAWTPSEPVDVVISAATLQWVPGHGDLIPRFVSWLAPGGSFAFQVPGNFDQASHVLLRDLAGSPRWRERLGHLADPNPVRHPSEYLEILLATGADADVWETTYLHVLQGQDAVLQWVRGTALRPYLSALEDSPGDSEDFVAGYAEALRSSYPRDASNRTIFPFRRIFGIAHCPKVETTGYLA
jgi:trans-aconitate 2-methyltransferase